MSVRTSLRRTLGAALAGLLIVANTPVGAANWFEKNFYLSGPRYDFNLPACDNYWALLKIKDRFSSKESTFWVSELKITNFDQIREVAFRPWADGTVPRRFCTGRALVSDGIWRTVKYSIVEDGGMIGWTWGVDWCVVGLDRNWAYNPACKEAEQ